MRRFTLQPDQLAGGRVTFDAGRVASPQPRAAVATGRYRDRHRRRRPRLHRATRGGRRSRHGNGHRGSGRCSRISRWPSRWCRAFPRATRWRRSSAPPPSWASPASAPPSASGRSCAWSPRAGAIERGAGSAWPARPPSSRAERSSPRSSCRGRSRSASARAADLALCLWEGGGEPLGTPAGGRRDRSALGDGRGRARGRARPRRGRGRAGRRIDGSSPSVTGSSGPRRPGRRSWRSSSPGSETCDDPGRLGAVRGRG